MRPFSYQAALDPATASRHFAASHNSVFLAGGTTLLDLMKLDVMRPETVVDINGLSGAWSSVNFTNGGLSLGAMARMSDVADHPDVQKNYPIIVGALKLAASAQLRNMATLGGNVLQRTRCTYFRDVSYNNCNKREPGSGCAALDGVNRRHAVLGTSDHCIATYPGDFAQALIALDASVRIAGPRSRTMAFADLHKLPGDTPQVEFALAPGELIAGFDIPVKWPRSLYLKVRDRESYEFALASAAVALDMEGGVVRDARIALGGVATVPWRAREAESILKNQKLTNELVTRAADVAFQGAKPRKDNSYKIELGKRTLARALTQVEMLEI